MMRYHVTVPVGAIVTLARTYEIEAKSEAEAIDLIDSDEAHELPDDEFFIVSDDIITDIHSSEIIDAKGEFKAKRVG